MKVRDIMSFPPLFAKENDTIQKISKIMKVNDVGAVVICDSSFRVSGIITDRDIILKGICENKNPGTTLAKEIMTKNVTTVSPLTSADDAFEVMAELKVRRLPVVENKTLVGIVTLGDMSQFTDYSTEIADTVFEVCKGCEKKFF